MTEYLDDLPPIRLPTTVEIVTAVLAKLDNTEWHSPEERSRKFLEFLKIEGKQVLDAIPVPRAIR